MSAGDYWAGEAAPGDQISVEEGLAEALGFGLGDVVEFTIAGQARSARVTSLRRVQWDSFDVNFFVLVPAFMTSELKTAFQMGFMMFIPFLVIDLIVASVLMSMGMMMLSPLIISLPFKIMLFVLVDGWALIVGTLASSFYT